LVDVLIKDEMNGKPQHEKLLILGNTPRQLIQSAGFPELPLAIKAKVISKACFDHGIATSMLKRLPDIIANPKCIFKSANAQQSDSVVVLTLEIKNESPIIIPIIKYQQVGRQSQKAGRQNAYNLVTSVYAKEGPNPERKWREQGLLLWE